MNTEARNATFLRRAMSEAKDDNLERANLQFQNWADEQLDAPYGQSDQTGREVWQTCKDNRADWEAANAFLEDMLKAKGL